MDKQLLRIEDKIDRLDDKLSHHIERIAKVETSVTWLKWALTILLSLSGTLAVALTRYIEK